MGYPPPDPDPTDDLREVPQDEGDGHVNEPIPPQSPEEEPDDAG